VKRTDECYGQILESLSAVRFSDFRLGLLPGPAVNCWAIFNRPLTRTHFYHAVPRRHDPTRLRVQVAPASRPRNHAQVARATIKLHQHPTKCSVVCGSVRPLQSARR